ncbi:MAG: protein translocase SEC61 complex subunit gamma [Halobacteria archaeon]|nr:protein translocase SEC61 complex subunit gamma [Halobacteria archaeon]
MDIDFSLNEYIRVLKLARTPTWQEFKQASYIAGGGIIFIGLVGFLIFVVMRFLPPAT